MAFEDIAVIHLRFAFLTNFRPYNFMGKPIGQNDDNIMVIWKKMNHSFTCSLEFMERRHGVDFMNFMKTTRIFLLK